MTKQGCLGLPAGPSKAKVPSPDSAWDRQRQLETQREAMRTHSNVIVLTMLLLMIGASQVHAAHRNTGELRAKSAIAMDLGTGNIVYEQNADEQIPPASLTKVLTLYLTFEALQEKRLALTDTVLVTPEATQAGGSLMNIRPGERVIVRELMKGIAVASGNDACVALAQHLCGSDDVHPFVAAMNSKARELGTMRIEGKEYIVKDGDICNFLINK